MSDQKYQVLASVGETNYCGPEEGYDAAHRRLLDLTANLTSSSFAPLFLDLGDGMFVRSGLIEALWVEAVEEAEEA